LFSGVRQLIERDKERFEINLKQSLQSIVPFCLSRELSKKGDAHKQDFELIPLEPSKLPPGAIIRGSFDTKEYQSDRGTVVMVFCDDLRTIPIAFTIFVAWTTGIKP
jgi:hypothetical protein